MGIWTWIFYIIIGFLLFVFINFLEKKYNITKLQNLVFSLIFMMVIGGITSNFGFGLVNDNLFLIFVFTLIYEIIYVSYFLEKDFFEKNNSLLKFYIILIIIGYLLNQEFINRVDMVFLSGEDLRVILWFLAIIFIYQFIKDKELIKNKENLCEKFGMSGEGIVVSYAKLKHKYYNEIKYDNKELVLILYSIMIFENYNRPAFLRKYDNFLFKLNGGSRKLGIMQVKSNKFISDFESIELVYKKLEKIVEKKKVKKINVDEVINMYCKDNSVYVKNIYDCICKI